MLLQALLHSADAQTLAKADDGTGIHVYYRTGWTAPYIHYTTGSGWTTSPGLKMTPSTDTTQFPPALGWFKYDIAAPATSLDFVFNNGAGTWDNNNNANYKVASAGTWSLTSKVSTPPTAALTPAPTPSLTPAPTPAATPAATTSTVNIRVYFRTAWAPPYIHYNQGSGWTTSPGIKMTASSDYVQFPPEEGWFKFDIAAPATSVEFVFNNGAGIWDNNGGSNYKISSTGTYLYATKVSTPPTRGSCWTWEGLDQCQSSSQTDFPDSDETRKWQTPPRNSANWSLEYQDYRSLTGYAHVEYAADRLSATVTARTFLRANATCSYTFNNAVQSSPQFIATSALKADLLIKVDCTATSTGEKWNLGLDPVNFVWQANSVNQPAGMENGQRGAVVDFFGWPYKDIEEECKDFLGKAGYMGVKIPPPQESLFSNQWTFEDQRNPWYITYQPVSYRLYSRLGSRAELRSMIQTCRANGVRVYTDAVVNHMASGGNDIYATHRKDNGNSQCAKWSAKSSTKGSPYFTHSYAYIENAYTGQRPAMEYPAVPFGPTDFHCERTTGNAKDPFYMEHQWLLGLSDLNTRRPYVRERIAQYFVDLLGVGISGLRVDAIKHIGPTDAAAIFGLLSKYMGGSFPADFVSWGEIVISDDANVVACDSSSSYNFYTGLDAKFLAEGISQSDLNKLKLWSWDYPNNFPLCGSWILPASRFVIQNDDHDQQPADSVTRPMGDKGSVLVRDKDVNKHRGFEKLLFTRTDADWKIRVVLSSYTFFPDGSNGFPDGFSDCAGFDTSLGNKCLKGVPYEKAFRAGSCGYTVENFVGGKYTRVHRDLGIVNAMRSWIGNLTAVTATDVAIARCLTGVDLFDLARSSRRSWQLLSQNTYWRERLTDNSEEQGERGDTTTTTIVTALQWYIRAYSLRFRALCKDGATADTVIAAWLARGSCTRVSLFDARAIREDTPFAFGTWFCLLDGGDDKYKNATMHTGGILFGAQSVSYDDNRWAYYHQQFAVVSADRKLYCSVIAERLEIASNLEINYWYNLTLFYDHQTQRVFLDGVLVSTLRTALHHEWWRLGPAQVGTGCITAGEDQQFPNPRRCGWYPFNGLIDNF